MATMLGRLAPLIAAGLAMVVVAGCGRSNAAASGTYTVPKALDNYACPADADHVGASRPGPRAGGRLQVATTVAPITSIVAEVAGDRADVRGVIPEGTDSHTFEPKPSVAETFAKADVVFVNGLHLEDPTKTLATRTIPGAGQVVDLGDHTITPAEQIYDFSFPRAGGKPNPHLWTNPPMAACYAVIAGSVLAKADPANASYYEANAQAVKVRIDDLDQRFRTAAATVAPAHRKLLTYHDAYAYFAAHYGWTIIGAIQVSSFEDPTPKEVARLIAQVKREKVPAIFGSEVFPSTVLAQIGTEAGVRYVDTLRDDDLPGRPGDADHSYLGLMKADYVTMISSLGGDATAVRAFDPADVTPDKADYPQ
jgi:ABC-type Zn uptake system ZnuABC Zn-binding protein ZnuA